MIGLITTAAAFITDRAWESMDGPAWTGAYRVIDMFGLAGILLALGFSVFGALLGRNALVAAPLVLSAAAIPHTLDGYASSSVWWLGAMTAAIWALVAAGRSWRRLMWARSLAGAYRSERTATVGANAVLARKRAVRNGFLRVLLFLVLAGGAGVATLAVLPMELGRTYEEMEEQDLSSFLAAAGMAAAIMAAAVGIGWGWRLFALYRVGANLIWEIPVDSGRTSWVRHTAIFPGHLCTSAVETPDCSCLAELHRAFPDEEYEPGVLAAMKNCP